MLENGVDRGHGSPEIGHVEGHGDVDESFPVAFRRRRRRQRWRTPGGVVELRGFSETRTGNGGGNGGDDEDDDQSVDPMSHLEVDFRVPEFGLPEMGSGFIELGSGSEFGSRGVFLKN